MGFGGLGGRDKSYDWAGHARRIVKEEEVIAKPIIKYIDDNYSGQKKRKLKEKYDKYIMIIRHDYEKKGFRLEGFDDIKQIIKLATEKSVIDNMPSEEGKLGFKL